MDGFFILLADTFTESVKQATDSPRFDTRDLLLAASLGLVIAIALFLVVYVRFKNRPRERGELIDGAAVPVAKKQDDWEDEEEEEKPVGKKPGQRQRRRKRRRRRAHRPVNPTLQQTGGLPPVRPDDQLPKY